MLGEVKAEIDVPLYDERACEELSKHRHRRTVVAHEYACGMYRRDGGSSGLHNEEKSNSMML